MNIEGVQEMIIMLFGPKWKKILQLKKKCAECGIHAWFTAPSFMAKKLASSAPAWRTRAFRASPFKTHCMSIVWLCQKHSVKRPTSFILFSGKERGGCPSSPRPSRSLERTRLHYRTHLRLLLPGQCCLAAAPSLFRPLSS